MTPVCCQNVILVIFVCKILAVLGEPSVFSANVQICRLIHKKRELRLQDKHFTVKNENFIIDFNVCGSPLHTGCTKESSACLFDKKLEKHFNLGNKFVPNDGENNVYKSINGETCNQYQNYSLHIYFICWDTLKVYPILQDPEEDTCIIKISMLDPNCNPKCTARTQNGDLIDLSALKTPYLVKAENRSFSIQICGTNKNCSAGINSCEIKDNDVIPLVSDEFPRSFRVVDSGINIVGRFKNNKLNKKLELQIYCNWKSKMENLRAVKLNGHTDIFSMESSYACIKYPTNCMIRDGWYYYNLENLNNPNGYWKVLNMPDGKMVLNICGPLKLQSNNSCTDSYSQVCYTNKGKYVNKGSILPTISIENDDLMAHLTSGDKCEKNPNDTYSTKIIFKCSKSETGPVYVKTEGCTIFLTWRTPAACPIPDAKACNFLRPVYSNCIIDYKTQSFDLTSLQTETAYVINDTKANVQYLLNICAPVSDSGAPCIKDSMVVMKKLDEPNPKLRYVILAKIQQSPIWQEGLMIDSNFGDFCEGIENYRVKIRFQCSSQNKHPILIKHDKCNFEFLWQTLSACASPVCSVFVGDHNNSKLSLNYLDKSVINVSVSNDTKLRFQMCNSTYKECNSESCSEIPMKKSFHLKANDSVVTFEMGKTYEVHYGNFNRVNFEINCQSEVIQNNGITNKTLDLTYSPSQLCQQQVGPCQVQSKKTQFTLDINNLAPLSVPLYNTQCPKVVFNEDYQFVILQYKTNITCSKIFDNDSNIKMLLLNMVLKCTQEDVSQKYTTNSPCTEFIEIHSPESCKLFESPKSWLLTIAIVTICVLCLIVYGGIYVYKRSKTRFICYTRNLGV